jgi:DNA repair protein RadD
MQLRPYQQEAVSAALKSLGAGANPVLQLATGTGKSLIIAELARRYAEQNRNAWCLTHVQQLVKQNAATYTCYTGCEPGIVCAGLNRKDAQSGPVFATIQSMMGMLSEMPDPHLVIIDEAHRVPHNEGEPTLYETILRRYPNALRVAMTATPWRMDNGIIYGKGEQFWFDRLAYNYTVPRAVSDGWLCPLVGVETEIQLDVEDVSVQGDFVQSEADELQTELWLEAVARSVMDLTQKRNHIAVYCPTVAAAQRTARIISEQTDWTTDVMHGGLSQKERDEVFGRFFSGETRVLCSVDMITTGFDFPPLDCIVCLRPTLSSSLWVQIQGRGTRLHESKKNCLVLDYVGNLIRLGGVDMYEKFYREKGLVEVEAVPQKPYVKKERKVYPGIRSLTPIDPMTGKEVGENSELIAEVHNVNSVAIQTRGKPYPVMLVQYACTSREGARIDASAFINTQDPNDATSAFFKGRRLAIRLPSPAKTLSWQVKGARKPTHVRIRKSGRYWNVLEEYFGDTK